MQDADSPEYEILDIVTLSSWNIHRFWKSLVRHFLQLQNQWKKINIKQIKIKICEIITPKSNHLLLQTIQR